MMKVLIDTNIILDVLVKREPFYIPSARIWTLVREDVIEGHLSAISVNNLYYIIKRLKGEKTAELFVDQILEEFEIIALTKSILKQARTVSKKDFEDLIQYFSGIHEGCDAIVSRNEKDFPAVGIRIMNPPKLLKIIEKGSMP